MKSTSIPIYVLGTILCLGTAWTSIQSNLASSRLVASCYAKQSEISSELQALQKQLSDRGDAPASGADVHILSQIVGLEVQYSRNETFIQSHSAPTRSDPFPISNVCLIVLFFLLSGQIEAGRKKHPTTDSSRPSTNSGG